jgi:hypothetical protein
VRLVDRVQKHSRSYSEIRALYGLVIVVTEGSGAILGAAEAVFTVGPFITAHIRAVNAAIGSEKNNMSASPDIWSAEIGFFMAIPLFFSCQLRFRVDNIMHILQA